jgi:hypothetical protein
MQNQVQLKMIGCGSLEDATSLNLFDELFNVDSKEVVSSIIKGNMGPRGGIEPPSREPQSLMLPVHHLGH